MSSFAKSDPAPTLELSNVEAALEAIGSGGMAIVVDDPRRENEGDLVMAASHVTPTAVNFMATHGRGLICVPMARERLDDLRIPPMVDRCTDPRKTAFHVGVDLRGQATGISAAERAATIRALANPSCSADDFRKPGHVFPLARRPGGVLERPGHTEASIDLSVLAGAGTAAMICEIAADDGEMMRLPQLCAFANQHALPIVAISDLIDYLAEAKQRIARVSAARLPRQEGAFTVIGYRDLVDGREHLAVVLGDVHGGAGVLARVHSECLTGDVFRSRRCDCGSQLELALSMIANAGAGVVVYLRGHEGRGIGLLEKLSAYQLQDQGLDTVEANLALGHPADGRDYAIGAEILKDLGINGIRLMTNNPTKRDGLERHGISIIETVPLVTDPTPENVRYLDAKGAKMGHVFEAVRSASAV
jgi:3,4-dihydroxy 2-butanone 4-phosphate synthase/GTP cyclohydrolase II